MSGNYPSTIGPQIEEVVQAEDYLQATCSHLIETSADDTDSELEPPAEPEGLLGRGADEDIANAEAERVAAIRRCKTLKRRAFFVRTVALLCACSLSVGSHYSSNILGPLKSRLHRELGTSHTEFGLLLSAYSLNSTWTPLVGGVLASRLGTTFTSILATGIILLGQICLLLGDSWGNVRLMALGIFIFGLGVSPLAVVQETIIVRFFKSHGLGVSMAFGLIAGKGASFLAARTSYPLTERFGPRAPFCVATALATLSVIVNLVYISLSNWLIDGAGAELEAPDISQEARRRLSISVSEAQALEKVAKKKQVHVRQITRLGDVFWAYIGLNVFCGMIWTPFTHLAANIIETRYKLSEPEAANTASYLLAGAVFLYPLCGYLVDNKKHRPIVVELLLVSSTLTMLAYLWLAMPPTWTKSPIPAVVSFALGHGFSPLLLVVIVPRIVPLKYVSTALGAHKSMEQTGSVLLQTLAGVLLDSESAGNKASAFQDLLNSFLILNGLHFCTILLLAYLQHQKDVSSAKLPSRPSSTFVELPQSPRRHSMSPDQETPLLSNRNRRHRYSTASDSTRLSRDMFKTKAEIRRGRVLALLCVALVVASWVLFMTTAWFKLGKRGEKH